MPHNWKEIESRLNWMLNLMKTGTHQIKSPQNEYLILRDLYFAQQRMEGKFGMDGTKKIKNESTDKNIKP